MVKPIDSWSHLTDDHLLDVRLSDLRVSIAESELEPRVQQLFREIEAKGIGFLPHCYLSDEWFSPEGWASIALPFYLAHPRLKKLEEAMMLEVEGGTAEDCMKLLRHETGHAICHAFRFDRTRAWRNLFGDPHLEYEPDRFHPRPYSKSFVVHLDRWYSQSHPDEDFAETFAVWLDPESDWNSRYKGWPVLKKLRYIDDVMRKHRGRIPSTLVQKEEYPLASLHSKLRTHYQRKRKEYAHEYPDFYDGDLRKIFSGDPTDTSLELASRFMRREREEIIGAIHRWTRERKVNINRLLKALTDRSHVLKLRLAKGRDQTLLEVTVLLTSLVTVHLLTGRFERPV